MTQEVVLVTGAAGFLGSHLCDRLLAEGRSVVGLDNLVTGDLANLAQASKSPRFRLLVRDVRETIPVRAGLIFNLACPASPVHYQKDPILTTTTCVLGALRVLETARDSGARVVHASTSEVYGSAAVHPQPESYWGHVNPTGPRSCYDEGKRCAESLLRDANLSWGVDVRVARIFNTYGPRMALDDGRVISAWLARALTGAPIEIFGDGRQTRSFCYVDDLVDGLLALSRAPSLDGPVNLGNPEEVTLLELRGRLEEVLGKRVSVLYRTLPVDDPPRRCPDVTCAAALGFWAQTPLIVGLGRTAEDFRARVGR